VFIIARERRLRLIEWKNYQDLLIAETQVAIRAFFAKHPADAPPFAISDNPHAFYQAQLAKVKAADPEFDDAEMRWDSGFFQYPACIELGAI
jgi:hypothetical protein